MTYKHENDVIDAVDFIKPSYGTEKHQEIQQELVEVYRKAEAFDNLKARVDLWIEQLNEVRPTNEIHRAVIDTQLKAAKDVQEAMEKHKESDRVDWSDVE